MEKVKICEHCKKPFKTSSSRKKYCDRNHTSKCEYCGKEFPIANTYDGFHRRFCSQKCASLYNSSAKHSVCSVCGKLNSDTSQSICEDCRTIECPICGNRFILTSDEYIRGKKTCSEACRYALSQQTYSKNYGKELNPDGHKAMMSKYKQTCIDRFGVDNPMKSREVSRKAVETKREIYGEDLAGITEKIESTLESRYGSPHLMHIDSFKEKSRKTCMFRYGVDNYAKSIQFLEGSIISPEKAEAAKRFRDNPHEFISANFPDRPSLGDISKAVGMRESSVGWIIDKQSCQDDVRWVFSKMEEEVTEYIKHICPSANIVANTRKIITPYELDIYLPEYKLAIECNPTSTHNSSFSSGFGDHDKKGTNYHKMKSDECAKHGIFLFHIFGYEWSHKQEVIKSMIRNILGKNKSRIGARECEIREVSYADSCAFLEENHRQGMCNSSVRIGLYYKGELVSLMTFGKMRSTIGTCANADNSSLLELSRFCNRLNTSVAGGASKLFNYFCANYPWKEIRSFSDKAHTKGNLYKKLGFRNVRESEPGYVWVNMKSDLGYSRLNTQKSNICKFLNDDSIDLNLSETQIMEAHGYAKVCDSGTVLWSIVNDSKEENI